MAELSAYYLNVVVPYLASGVIITGSLKKEALNEIRNALTHISRAYEVDDRQDQEVEFSSAERHLQRVALDSAKDAIFELREKSERAIATLESDFLIKGSVHSDLASLNRKRIDLTKQEAAASPNISLVNEFGKLLNEYDKFYADLDREYTVETVTKRIRARKWKVGIGILISFVLGLSASYLANHIPLVKNLSLFGGNNSVNGKAHSPSPGSENGSH